MITLKTALGIEFKDFKVIEIPAVGCISDHIGDGMHNFSIKEFKAQQGLIPVVENYGFEIKCLILGYDVIRISFNGKVYRANNKGSKFNTDILKLIRDAESKDIYLFRNIEYKCPGNISVERIRDMIFEIE